MEIHKAPFQYICTKNSVIYNGIHPGSILCTVSVCDGIYMKPFIPKPDRSVVETYRNFIENFSYLVENYSSFVL